MAPILVQPFGALWSPTTKPPTYMYVSEELSYSERVPVSIPAGAAFLAPLEPVDAAARCPMLSSSAVRCALVVYAP